MLELSIMCVIALAGAYWMALFLMGRREDVLHGDFIRATQPATPDAPHPARAVLPRQLSDLRRAAPVRATLPRPVNPPETVRPMTLPKRVEPAVLVKSVDPVQPVEPFQPAPAHPLVAAKERARALRKPVPDAPAPAAPAWRRPQAAEPERADVLQSLLETIKRDLGDAVSG